MKKTINLIGFTSLIFIVLAFILMSIADLWNIPYDEKNLLFNLDRYFILTGIILGSIWGLTCIYNEFIKNK
jgi:hypothetical protein